MTERELLERTKQFALRIFKLVGALPQTIQRRAVAAQLIRSGTSVAANYRAACRARIETELLRATKVQPLLTEASEIVAIMASSKKTAAKSQIANRKSQIR